jgi:hypothetical protein
MQQWKGKYMTEENDARAADDRELIWASVLPVVKLVRGKTFDIKSEVYGGLGHGLRSLFIFQVLRGHIGSGAEELFKNLPYLLGKAEVWREMKNAFLFFGCGEMAKLIDELQQIYNELITEGVVKMERIFLTDERLFGLMPETEQLIAAYIRNHPEEFEVSE